MGQKVSPVGLRIGINKTWESRWYADNKDFAKFLNNDNNFEKDPSYIDFVLDEQSYIGSPKYTKDEEFWKEYLSNFAEPVRFKV